MNSPQSLGREWRPADMWVLAQLDLFLAPQITQQYDSTLVF